ncbi:MAG: hypothetical protein ISF22_10895 [Methanomassiliicoccus sp.]|nr:hypothetical protein [Methanomassiliicoccus sp.]
MFPPRWFLPYDAILQIITALVALAVAVYALRGYQWVKERTLYALFLAFVLLSGGLLVSGVTLAYTYLVDVPFSRHVQPLVASDLGFWVYYMASMMAFSILVIAYASRLRPSLVALAGMLIFGQRSAGGSLVSAGPFMEMVLVVLLLFIVIAQLAHLIARWSWHSLMVTASFTMIMGSHVLMMFSSIEDTMYVLGRIVGLAGFLSLAGVLYLLRRKG